MPRQLGSRSSDAAIESLFDLSFGPEESESCHYFESIAAGPLASPERNVRR